MEERMDDQVKFDSWAIVDVMGHNRFVGRVTEQVVAGQGFVRVDIPKTDAAEAWTKLIGTASIYAITPISEELAIKLAKSNESVPIQPYEMRQLTKQNVLTEEPEYF